MHNTVIKRSISLSLILHPPGARARKLGLPRRPRRQVRWSRPVPEGWTGVLLLPQHRLGNGRAVGVRHVRTHSLALRVSPRRLGEQTEPRVPHGMELFFVVCTACTVPRGSETLRRRGTSARSVRSVRCGDHSHRLFRFGRWCSAEQALNEYGRQQVGHFSLCTEQSRQTRA